MAAPPVACPHHLRVRPCAGLCVCVAGADALALECVSSGVHVCAFACVHVCVCLRGRVCASALRIWCVCGCAACVASPYAKSGLQTSRAFSPSRICAMPSSLPSMQHATRYMQHATTYATCCVAARASNRAACNRNTPSRPHLRWPCPRQNVSRPMRGERRAARCVALQQCCAVTQSVASHRVLRCNKQASTLHARAHERRSAHRRGGWSAATERTSP